MKYCEQTTINHLQVKKYSSVLDGIFSVLDREGCVLKSESPFNGGTLFKIIDGDELEKKFCLDDGRNLSCRNKSVDIIFGIDGVVKQMQFVELKLNCGDDFYYLDKTSFRQKSDGSKLALGNCVPIAKKHYIVFDASVLNQAKNFLFRLNPILGNDFVAINVNELYAKFFN